MVKQTTRSNESSSLVWNNLEEMVRLKVREFIQSLLEAEMEELLGRQRSERRNLGIAHRFIAMAMGKSAS